MDGLVDTHCHIHAAKAGRNDFTAKKWHEAKETDPETLQKSAAEAGVTRLLCVGTDLSDSIDAVEFVQTRDNCYSSIGVHPHEAKVFLSNHTDLAEFEKLLKKDAQPSGLDAEQGASEQRTEPYKQYGEGVAEEGTRFSAKSGGGISGSAGKQAATTRSIVAVGEIGLDYYYEHSPRVEQIKLLEMFLQLVTDKNLPVIFHIREAFSDFWPILSHFKGVRGVLHSYTADIPTLDKAVQKGLYIGLNGIMTFTRDENQLEMAKKVPLERLLLETDAPYLAPKPHRGKVCRPEYVKDTAEFLANLRNEDFRSLAEQTTKNARLLFRIDL